jgi:hypothetical protein
MRPLLPFRTSAPLRLSHHGGRAIRDTRRNSRVKNHSDHFHCDADVLRPHSSMELRLMEVCILRLLYYAYYTTPTIYRPTILHLIYSDHFHCDADAYTRYNAY